MEVLKQLRESSNMTQAELARELHVSQQSIWKYESGTNMPPIETLMAIAKFFDVTMESLVADDGNITRIISDKDMKLRQDERDLIVRYRLLDAESKKLVNELSKKLIKNSRS